MIRQKLQSDLADVDTATPIAAIVAPIIDALHSISAQPSARWLTIEAASRYSNLSAKSLRRLISAGRLTPHRPVGTVLLDRVEIDSVIAASTATPRKRRGIRTSV